MLFWAIAIALVILVGGCLYVPFKRAQSVTDGSAALFAALEAELSEIERDRGERFAHTHEAEAARAEVARRMFALEREENIKQSRASSPLPNWAYAFLLIPILAVPTYLMLGAPEYDDQRMAMRIDGPQIAAQNEISDLVDRVETRLRAAPDDARGWAVIAPVYVRLGRIDDAIEAYGKAAEFSTAPAVERANFLANQGELMVSLTQGDVSEVAAKIFVNAIALDPDNEKALFFDAIYTEQTEPAEIALANWRGLVEQFSDQNPPWLSIARERTGQTEQNNVAPQMSSSEARGPDADAVAAAQDMAPEDRMAMIGSMVEGLAEKLASDPNDVDGWVRLMRSYVVLGRMDDARLALANARKAFPAGSNDRSVIEQANTQFGVEQDKS